MKKNVLQKKSRSALQNKQESGKKKNALQHRRLWRKKKPVRKQNGFLHCVLSAKQKNKKSVHLKKKNAEKKKKNGLPKKLRDAGFFLKM